MRKIYLVSEDGEDFLFPKIDGFISDALEDLPEEEEMVQLFAPFPSEIISYYQSCIQNKDLPPITLEPKKYFTFYANLINFSKFLLYDGYSDNFIDKIADKINQLKVEEFAEYM